MGELRRRFPENTMKTVPRENIRLAETPSFREAITTYGAHSAGAEDYRTLAREVLSRWGVKSKRGKEPNGPEEHDKSQSARRGGPT
jgi:chromosome partitioning protein